MFKAMIGMLKWKFTMWRCRNMEPYTDEWWEIMMNSLEFVPEEAREMMFNGLIQMTIAM